MASVQLMAHRQHEILWDARSMVKAQAGAELQMKMEPPWQIVSDHKNVE
jgi:hypothetical protein